MRLDELARRAGVATTTVRLYQHKGLLARPLLVGRTGYYDEGHVARLALIGRLADQGFSLAGISRLLDAWEEGHGLDHLVGAQGDPERPPNGHPELVMDATDLLARFPPGSLTPELIQRAASMGLVEATPDGRFRIPDRRFLETGATLVGLGIPARVMLDEWAHLMTRTDEIADRFITVFEHHLLGDERRDLSTARATELASTLGQLREVARQVLTAALDTSLTRKGTSRLGELAGEEAHRTA